jgi:hypothetical protein
MRCKYHACIVAQRNNPFQIQDTVIYANAHTLCTAYIYYMYVHTYILLVFGVVQEKCA